MDPTAVVASTDRLEHDPERLEPIDRLEVRLDLGTVAVDDILAADAACPLILTNRLDDEGGRASPGADRFDPLEAALEADAVWGIDIEHRAVTGDSHPAEAAAAARLAESAADAGVAVICSCHPAELPRAAALRTQLDAAAGFGDIAKVAAPVASLDDLGRLTAVTRAAIDDGVAAATMATGRYGPASRVVAIAAGCPLVYGHLPGATPVAAGQLAVDHLTRIVDAAGR